MGSQLRRRRALEEQLQPLPLPPGPVSNGEYLPAAPSEHDRALARLIRSGTDGLARRAGCSRRAFLQGAGGVVASLAAFELAARTGAAGPGGVGRGGTYVLPSAEDPEACAVALGGAGSEFVFDVHTHYATPNGAWVHDAPETLGLVLDMLPADCSDADKLDCVDESAYLHDVFLASDTTMAVLTDLPNSGPTNAPVPFGQALKTERLIAALGKGGADRLLVENILAPNVGPLQACLEEMTSAAETRHVAAFKVYTAWSPNRRGYSLEDPRIGLPTVQHAHDLGVEVFVAHKGLPLVNFDPAFNHPDDMVALSRQFPSMNFLIYHAAWDPSHIEGPYDPHSTVGVDTVLSALDRHQVPPNANVWVDIASMWRVLLAKPDQAAHAIGKLLKRVGERRVLWGTDSIWFGSPQAQILAMRAFSITTEYQERYGYPALSSEVKQRLFGLNAAELFKVDPAALRCGLAGDTLASGRAESTALHAEAALPSPWRPRGPVTRRQMLGWLRGLGSSWRPT